MPEDTKIRILDEEYTNKEILKSLADLQMIVSNSSDYQMQTEIKKRFQLIDLSPPNEPPTITGYYEVRIHGKTNLKENTNTLHYLLPY